MPAPFFWLPLLAGLVGPLQDDAAPTTPLLDHAALGTALAEIADSHPDQVTKSLVETSRGGRSIELLTIGTGETNERMARPGILIVAGTDGSHAYTSGIAVSQARALASGYGSDDAVTALLDTTTVYIVARMNPDACEGRFGAPLAVVRGTGHGIDNDRDGRNGEDDHADVNADGFITMMRVPDPTGQWISDPTNERAMVEADRDKGERGMWKLVTEGLDDDGDEEVAEDPVRDAEVNRNFAHDWNEHGAEAGLFPTDEPAVRGMCELMLRLPNVQLVLTYGQLDNLIGKPKSVKDNAPATHRVPPLGVMESDVKLIEQISKGYKTLTGDKCEGASKDGSGTFQTWAYTHRGVLTLNIDPWCIPLDAKEKAEEGDEGDGDEEEEEEEEKSKDAPKPSDDAKRLIWCDNEGEGARHLGWTEFDHPTLGAVEIGGFAPYALVEPPDAVRAKIEAKQQEFLLTLGAKLARIELKEAEARDLGGGLLEVTAALENDSFLPLFSRSGRRARTQRPARVLLELPVGATMLAGSRQTLVSELAGSGGRREFRWLVQGADASAISISVSTIHAGSSSVTPEVK